MITQINRKEIRQKRHLRVRNRLFGSSARPRLSVFRSSKNIYAQIIDDETGKTLVSASTVEADVKSKVACAGNKEAAAVVGKLIAERALGKEIKAVIFDRGGFLYHGRIKELADAAREAGLDF